MQCVPVVKPRVDAAIPVRVSKERAIGMDARKKSRPDKEISCHRPPALARRQMRDAGKRCNARVTSIFRDAMNRMQRVC
ncbi:hypothetical protein [Burkholderia cenocepacia]|uniref:hypothetical protein n=1 Tax=Burkholderia cenocepacia TaxID=95486 RepID=UPI0015C55FF9|nr:hypothetical protein [Burkholderia cenocepacia]